jgi:uncharacterized protein (UPF0333 family)
VAAQFAASQEGLGSISELLLLLLLLLLYYIILYYIILFNTPYGKCKLIIYTKS